MIAAILGATGLIGHAVLTQLVNDPEYHSIYVIARRAPLITSDKIQFIHIELAQLSQLNLPTIDRAFCTLGSTIKTAGSQKKFYDIDCSAVIEFAKQCQAEQTLVVSSLGASLSTGNFYLKTKAEMEQQLAALGLNKTVVIRPSLLLGKRDETRPLEGIGQFMAQLIGGIIPKQYRPISYIKVADHLMQQAKRPQTQSSLIIENATLFERERP